jgi:hypothetical protein
MHAPLQCVKFDDSSLSCIVWVCKIRISMCTRIYKTNIIYPLQYRKSKTKKIGQWNYYKDPDIIGKLIIHWRNVKWLIRNLVISKTVNISTNNKSMKSIRLVVVFEYCKVYIYKTTEICRLAAETFKNKKPIINQ